MKFRLALLVALLKITQIPKGVYGKVHVRHYDHPIGKPIMISDRLPNIPNDLESLPDINNAPDICQDVKIDCITMTQDRRTYVFNGDYYWEMLTNKIADGYPRVIKTDWDGLPGDLDAALTRPNGKTFFFKGSQYWEFYNREMVSGYPKEISVGFPGIPNNLDAATLWSDDECTYFFKGDKYWKYDNQANPPVSDRYPLAINSWEGLSNSVDAALKSDNGNTYFFVGDNYYRINYYNMAVDVVHPEYPRSTAVWWFDCKPVVKKENQEVKTNISGTEGRVLLRTDESFLPKNEDSTTPIIADITSPRTEDSVTLKTESSTSPRTDESIIPRMENSNSPRIEAPLLIVQINRSRTDLMIIKALKAGRISLPMELKLPIPTIWD